MHARWLARCQQHHRTALRDSARRRAPHREASLPRAGLPRRLLPREHAGQTIEIADEAAINRLVQFKQPGLMCQKLADGDSLFALPGELWPIGGHSFFVVKPAPGVREGERHGSQALGRRVDDHHRVLLPRLARLLVPDSTPEVDDLFAILLGTAGAPLFSTSRESGGKGFANDLKPLSDVSLYKA
jgi:hypothetical protein